MQYREGAGVYTADEQHVGNIERFVLDPRARRIIGLVVRKGFLFTEDKVIPVEKVATANEDRVVLQGNAGSSDDFPPFEEQHYTRPDESELSGDYPTGLVDPVYYYPTIGAMTWPGGMYPTGGAPISPAPGTVVPSGMAGNTGGRLVTERNIPEDAIALKTGAKVVSRDDEHVGDVDRVYTDPQSNKITHFSISQGFLFKKEKFLPAAWVQSATDEKVQLAVGSKTLNRLAEA